MGSECACSVVREVTCLKVKLAVLTFETMGQKVSENPSIATDAAFALSLTPHLCFALGGTSGAHAPSLGCCPRASRSPPPWRGAHTSTENTPPTA